MVETKFIWCWIGLSYNLFSCLTAYLTHLSFPITTKLSKKKLWSHPDFPFPTEKVWIWTRPDFYFYRNIDLERPDWITVCTRLSYSVKTRLVKLVVFFWSKQNLIDVGLGFVIWCWVLTIFQIFCFFDARKQIKDTFRSEWSGLFGNHIAFYDKCPKNGKNIC